MYLQKVISKKTFFISLLFFFVRVLKVNDENTQRNGSPDPDPDPHQNVMDPEHCQQYNIFSPNPAQHTVKDTLMGMLAKWRGRVSMDWSR
jgi:hypothetical protein